MVLADLRQQLDTQAVAHRALQDTNAGALREKEEFAVQTADLQLRLGVKDEELRMKAAENYTLE